VIGAVAAAAAGLAALAPGSSAVAASDAPTGNRAAIVFYDRSEAVMGGYQGLTFSGAGASYKVAQTGGVPFALGVTEAGFKRASDQVLVVQRGGVVFEEVDTLSAPGEPSLVVWKEGPTRWVEQLQRPGACVHAVDAQGAADFATIGQSFVEPEGSNFAPLQHSRGDETVLSTYSDEGATAHETDHIDAASGQWQFSRTVYIGGPFGGGTTSMSAFRYARVKPLVLPPPAGRCT
jgi:hypothetical protein